MLDEEEAIGSAEEAARRRILAAKQNEIKAHNAAMSRISEAQWLRDSRTGGLKTTVGGKDYLKMKAKHDANVRAYVKIALTVIAVIVLLILFRH